jgi:hypothetical protein
MFGSRDQRKGSTALGEEVAERSRWVCVAYEAADQIKRRRKGAREERDVVSRSIDKIVNVNLKIEFCNHSIRMTQGSL